MLSSSNFLLESLLEDGLVLETDLAEAKALAAKHSQDVIDALLSLSVITSRQLAITRAKICEYPFVDLSQFEVPISNTRLLPRVMSERLVAFPLFCLDEVATVGVLDPLNLQAIDQIRQILKMDVDPVLCDEEQLRAFISRAYSLSPSGAEFTVEQDLGEVADLTTGEEPIVAAVNQIIAGAVEVGASDVHLNPDEHELHVRYRIDGVLIPQQGPAKSVHSGLVQRLKVMGKLDLTQTRRPQDGKFRFVHRGGRVDVRVSMMPTINGENVVLRLLRPTSSIGAIDDLLMPEKVSQWFSELIERPHGMILVTGPTGSGKTTTLYTALAKLNRPDKNIMTIEDPVEIRQPLLRQVQVNVEIGLTFAGALRSILRQDPDVILVGEIRDEETARIAIQASLTGHVVFSTLHTNDATGAVARLRDFGVPSFAINAAVLCALAQRLVRRNCEHCASTETVDSATLTLFDLQPSDAASFIQGSGCGRCMSTGYKGRLGVFEMFRITPRVRQLVESGAPGFELQEAAMADGMRLMWEDGLAKARLGLTSMNEILGLRSVAEMTGGDQRMEAAA